MHLSISRAHGRRRHTELELPLRAEAVAQTQQKPLERVSAGSGKRARTISLPGAGQSLVGAWPACCGMKPSPQVALAPITALCLEGRAGRRGGALIVTDPNGDAVVRAVLGKAAGPAEAVFETAEGRWQLERGGGSAVVVVDPGGHAVATARKGEVVLAGGETLSWEQSSLPRTRYRLGGDLWVAEGRWLSRRRFSAELSETLLSRSDKSLLAGIASLLTHEAVGRRSRLLGGAGGFGASWG